MPLREISESPALTGDKPAPPAALVVRGIGRRDPKGDHWLIRDVSFVVNLGQRLALLGPRERGRPYFSGPWPFSTHSTRGRSNGRAAPSRAMPLPPTAGRSSISISGPRCSKEPWRTTCATRSRSRPTGASVRPAAGGGTPRGLGRGGAFLGGRAGTSRGARLRSSHCSGPFSSTPPYSSSTSRPPPSTRSRPRPSRGCSTAGSRRGTGAGPRLGQSRPGPGATRHRRAVDHAVRASGNGGVT